MQNPEPQEEREKGYSWRRELLSWVCCFLGAMLIVALLRMFVFSLIQVDGDSMMETLQDGDRILVTLFDGKWGLEALERGDVVICRYPNADHLSVKRIVGMPGETLEMFMGRLFIDGQELEEDYLTYLDYASFGPYTLGPDEYFVMGDNRPVSLDSRNPEVGPIARNAIEGVVRMVIWPEFKSIQ